MIRRILLLFALALAATPAMAQHAAGDWTGTLQVNAQVSLRLAVHIAQGEDGDLTGTMDSLDQRAMGIALANVCATDDALRFDVPDVGGSYEAHWEAGNWSGTWSQSGMSWPLVFAPGQAGPPAPPPKPLPANWSIPSDAEIGKMIEARIAGRPGESIVIGVIEPAGPRIVAHGSAPSLGGDTLYEIGSMTKVFTGLILADMVQKGEVGLDDAAQDYMPAGARLPEGKRKITLRDLATHRSGLPRLPANLPMGDPQNPYADYDAPLLLEFLAGYALRREPGQEYEYSNLGMGLLGYLLARHEGVDYETLVKRHVLDPLGMHDTAVTLTPGQRARLIAGHDEYLRPTGYWDMEVLAGAGALRSTAGDLVTFLTAATGSEPSPLSAAFDAMLAERAPGPSPEMEIGLSWMVLKSKSGEIVFHDGGTGGFRTAMAFDPARKRGVVVLTNAAAEPASNDLALHLMLGAPVATVGEVPAAPVQ